MGDAFGECVPPRHIVAPTKVVLLAQCALVDPVLGCPDLPARLPPLLHKEGQICGLSSLWS